MAVAAAVAVAMAGSVAGVELGVRPVVLSAAQGGTGSASPTGNTCSNARLAQNATGWSATSGGFGSRRAITGHVSADFGFRSSTYATPATISLPQQQVTAGQRWTFAFDAQISGSAARSVRRWTGTARPGRGSPMSTAHW